MKNNSLLTFDQTKELVLQGRKLVLAGNPKLLSQLPEGNWIGGTSYFFVDSECGKIDFEHIMVSDFTDMAEEVKFVKYDIDSIKNVYVDGFDNGFSIIILPLASDILMSYALEAPNYQDFAVRPVIGWVTGCISDDPRPQSQTYFMTGANPSKKEAVVMHVKLPKTKYADINLVNVYTPGDGDEIEALESGFGASDVLINGQKRNIAEYIREKNIDTRFPLVSDYNSAMINVSISSVSESSISSPAPLFKGCKYKFAKEIDVPAEIQKLVSQYSDEPSYGCVCIYNFLYGELGGKRLGNISAVSAYGEICYQLVNQTIVTLVVKDL